MLLESNRLILRSFDEYDFSFLKIILQDPVVMKFSINGIYKKDDQIKKFLKYVWKRHLINSMG